MMKPPFSPDTVCTLSPKHQPAPTTRRRSLRPPSKRAPPVPPPQPEALGPRGSPRLPRIVARRAGHHGKGPSRRLPRRRDHRGPAGPRSRGRPWPPRSEPAAPRFPAPAGGRAPAAGIARPFLAAVDQRAVRFRCAPLAAGRRLRKALPAAPSARCAFRRRGPVPAIRRAGGPAAAVCPLTWPYGLRQLLRRLGLLPRPRVGSQPGWLTSAARAARFRPGARSNSSPPSSSSSVSDPTAS